MSAGPLRSRSEPANDSRNVNVASDVHSTACAPSRRAVWHSLERWLIVSWPIQRCVFPGLVGFGYLGIEHSPSWRMQPRSGLYRSTDLLESVQSSMAFNASTGLYVANGLVAYMSATDAIQGQGWKARATLFVQLMAPRYTLLPFVHRSLQPQLKLLRLAAADLPAVGRLAGSEVSCHSSRRLVLRCLPVVLSMCIVRQVKSCIVLQINLGLQAHRPHYACNAAWARSNSLQLRAVRQCTLLFRSFVTACDCSQRVWCRCCCCCCCDFAGLEHWVQAIMQISSNALQLGTSANRELQCLASCRPSRAHNSRRSNRSSSC